MNSRRWRSAVLTAAATGTILLAAVGCSSTAPAASSSPLKIGASLPLTGPVADVAKSGEQGYQLWASDVNSAGGLLGRKVSLDILDDGFDTNAVVTNYNKLISEDKVDLLLGTFSSLTNAPASAVAARQHMLYVEPSGGNGALFTRGFTNLFFAQPGTTDTLPAPFVSYITGLSKDKRPQTAAYLTQDDPSVAPALAIFQKKFEALGIKTVYSQTYPPTTKSFDPVASAIAAVKPDMIVQGAVTDDGVQFVRSLEKVAFSPKFLFQTQSPSDPAYPDAIGSGNEEGVFTAVGWSPDAKYPGNEAFVAGYTKTYGSAPSEDAANSYTTGQVVAAAVKAVGSLNQAKLATWLHSHTVQTIVGPLKWDKTGVPIGSLLLAQWQGGTLKIVAPSSAATSSTTVSPKPNWQG